MTRERLDEIERLAKAALPHYDMWSVGVVGCACAVLGGPCIDFRRALVPREVAELVGLARKGLGEVEVPQT